jgi:hypothetical protein
LQKYRVQRQFERHILSVPVNITRKAPQKAAHYSQRVPGLTMEISEGGLSAMLTEAFKIGEAVSTSMRRTRHYLATGNARLTRPPGFEICTVTIRPRGNYESGWSSPAVDEGKESSKSGIGAARSSNYSSWYGWLWIQKRTTQGTCLGSRKSKDGGCSAGEKS